MKNFSTREAAKRLGLAHSTLSHYIEIGKMPAPKSITSGGTTVHIWSEEEIEDLRKLLPKIANGRKTRYQKKQSALSSQQSARAKSKSRTEPKSKKKKAKAKS